MRMMLKITMDTEKSNQVLRSGELQDLLQGTLDRLKPEAAYFGPEGGRRAAFIVFDMKDSSQLPPISEPLFQKVGASVDYTPVMDLQDLQKGLAAIG